MGRGDNHRSGFGLHIAHGGDLLGLHPHFTSAHKHDGEILSLKCIDGLEQLRRRPLLSGRVWGQINMCAQWVAWRQLHHTVAHLDLEDEEWMPDRARACVFWLNVHAWDSAISQDAPVMFGDNEL